MQKNTQLQHPAEFGKSFIELYMTQGFGTLNKRDVELLVIALLIRDRNGANGDDPDYHDLSLELRIPEARIRRLCYESALKYPRSQRPFAERLWDLLENMRFEVEGDHVRFVIPDALLRQTFEHHVLKLNSFTDSSFKSDIVKIKKGVFAELLADLYGKNQDVASLTKRMEKALGGQAPAFLIAGKQSKTTKELFGVFIENFLSSAGERSGERAVDAAFDAVEAMVNPVALLKKLRQALLGD